jgi:hypothetical protein
MNGSSYLARRSIFVASVVLVLAFSKGSVAATEESQANKLYLQGQYDEAAQHFIDLYIETSDPIFLRNLARCYYQMKKPDEAISRFREYLAKARRSAAKDRDEVERYIREMEELRRKRSEPESSESKASVVSSAPSGEDAAAPTRPAEGQSPTSTQPSLTSFPQARVPGYQLSQTSSLAYPESPGASRPTSVSGNPSAEAPLDGPRRGLVLMPYLGLQSFQGDSGNGLGMGFRLGGLVGAHINKTYSLNGELTLDLLNPNAQAGVDESAVELDFAFSPLVHISLGALELVFGPKLGIWGGAASASSDGLTATASEHGWLIGANVGLFTTLLTRAAALGGLLSFVARDPTEVCTTAPGETSQCTSSHLGPADKVIGVTAAALF